MTRVLSLMILAGALSGCEEIEPFLPTVSFNNLSVNTIDFQGAEVEFIFAVENPNPIEIGLSSFSYAFELAGSPLFDGDNGDGFVLEAADASELRLPVTLNWAETWQTVQATRGQDEVGFGLAGEFGFETPAGEARLPYDETGSFPAVRTPKFRLANLRATRFNLLQGTAELALDLGIDNEHGSSLFFDNFDYGIQVDGRTLASGLLSTFEVDGDSEGTLTVPIEVNLLTAGTSIVSAISGGGRLQVGLGASMDVETPFGILPLTIDETDGLNVINNL